MSIYRERPNVAKNLMPRRGVAVCFPTNGFVNTHGVLQMCKIPHSHSQMPTLASRNISQLMLFQCLLCASLCPKHVTNVTSLSSHSDLLMSLPFITLLLHMRKASPQRLDNVSELACFEEARLGWKLRPSGFRVHVRNRGITMPLPDTQDAVIEVLILER